MPLRDSPTLAPLIAAYEKTVVFEESLPNAFRLAKLFAEMRWAHGGLVLLGVTGEGQVTGVDPDGLDQTYARFEHLCAALTDTVVKMGVLHVGRRLVVFLVFNPIPRHVIPLRRYAGLIGRVATI